jgi:2-amino-4-hydroxy-6-hydroxymethyldihydropteridine diphosphokinase
MNKVYLLIGGNIGDRLANLKMAIDCIEQTCGSMLKFSAIYETEAWGFKHQAAFLNQALLIDTSLNASQLMQALLAIEKKMGRIRDIPLGPRIIDIDIIYFNEEVVETALVSIPHPRLAERKFVLMPLVEIAPQYIHPVLNKNNALLLEECTDSSAVYKKNAL